MNLPSEPVKVEKPFSRTDMLIYMGGITALAAVTVEVVLPATGVVARHFGKPAASGALLVGVYFLAYGIGQIFWGLYSDAFGRRRALLISLFGFSIASLACALAPSFELLLAARCAQGLMAGAPVIARAMVRDVSSGSEAARVLTMLGAILTMATLIAPVLGSGFLILFSWRAIFLALMALSLVFLAYTYFVLDPNFGRNRPERFSLKFLRKSARYLLWNRRFVVPAATGGLVFGGYASLGAVGAITAENRYGISPGAFGTLFTIAALANTAGALLAGQLLKRISLRKVGNLSVAILSGSVVLHLTLNQLSPNLQVFWISVCLYVLVFGMILPTSMASALEPAAEMPAFAASLYGACTMIAGFLGALMASRLYDGDHSAISYTMAFFGGGAVLVLILGRLLDRSGL
ncbi:hypothetical protein C5748_10390 [Phyllobacterium phragmitis]|uniref:Major facilitator superfamily (MFS) profile domain-containing protein n=1 Tax=Phyllobacterium phragmitis TaxID=2670329 RepID=A0A2S9ISZ6_9HYPH|nr:MFS transporter [Phyllobacterium phragmitis]PRD43652.1 hypothetical protein C5748_10390 [Phyllobacterium phragmitis]